MNSDARQEYINEFLYFVIRPDRQGGEGGLVYCSGVNVTRFLPITRGRHRPMSNPAVRGLQLVNLEVRATALEQQATPRALRGDHCAGIDYVPSHWYREQLGIENAPPSLPDEIISYCVVNLLRKINNAILLGANMPEERLSPDELQAFLDSLCTRYGS